MSLHRQSTSVTDLLALQVTGSNNLQPSSGMWKVNQGNENKSRAEVVKLLPGSSFNLLKSNFGFQRCRMDTFEESVLGQSRNGFHIKNDFLEERFRQVASRHLEALQTSGCQLSKSEANRAIGRLRTVIFPTRLTGTRGKSKGDRRWMPGKDPWSERKSDASLNSDRKRKVFTSSTSGFRNNFQQQQIAKNYNFDANCGNHQNRHLLTIDGMNIGKKK